MATIQKRGDKFRVIVRKSGITKTATFTRKKDAEHWGKITEIEIEQGEFVQYENLNFEDILLRYVEEITPLKKSSKSERLRINRFLINFQDMASKKITSLSARDVALWKEKRLMTVSPASVNREWNTLSAIYNYAIKGWGLSLPANPFSLVNRPKKTKPRSQRITNKDIEDILASFNYEQGSTPKTKKQLVAWSFLFAIETAMRISEILSITEDSIRGRIILLKDTKNGDDRKVPLSTSAIALIDLLPNGFPLLISSDTLSVMFMRHRPVHLSYIHFHDTRHEALSRMAKKITNPMDLAKISGHKDLKILMNTYYNPDDEHLVDLLD